MTKTYCDFCGEPIENTKTYRVTVEVPAEICGYDTFKINKYEACKVCVEDIDRSVCGRTKKEGE